MSAHPENTAHFDRNNISFRRLVPADLELLFQWLNKPHVHEFYDKDKEITLTEVAKSDSMLEKYDINKLSTFITETLSDLGETYKRSTLPQVKALLGSIFPSGITYSYDGTLNHQLNPMYQAILDFDVATFAYGDPKHPTSEPNY